MLVWYLPVLVPGKDFPMKTCMFAIERIRVSVSSCEL